MLRRRRGIEVDASFYQSYLSPVEYSQIVDWNAIYKGQFSKALGKGGGRLGPLGRRLRDLRTLEVSRSTQGQEWRPISSGISDTVSSSFDPVIPPPAPPLATPVAAASVPAPVAVSVPAPQMAMIEEIDLSGSIPTVSSSNPATVAATTYIQKVGSAASQFMLMMSTATTDFVNDVGRPVASSSGQQCPICFDTVMDPYMGRCSHIYCRKCLLDPNMHTERVSEYGGIEALRVRRCPQCRREGVSFYKMLS